MGFKYKLVEKSTNPRDKDAPKNWYGTPQSATALSGRAMTRAATKNTTTAPSEMDASLDLLADFIPDQLLQGHTVTIPHLGYFRLTFKSKGAARVADFNAEEMIYDVRPVFVPDKEFRERIKQNIEFEDGGVQVGKVSYQTRAAYYEATGQGGSTTPGTGGTEPGEDGNDGEEDSNNPLA